MKADKLIQRARVIHQQLRTRAAGARPDSQSAADYTALKAILDQLWTAADLNADVKQIRSGIAKLTIDGEYFAGLIDGEGFRDPAEVWKQYDEIAQKMP